MKEIKKQPLTATELTELQSLESSRQTGFGKSIKTENKDVIKLGAPKGTQGLEGQSSSDLLMFPQTNLFKIDLDRLSLADYYQMKDYYQIRVALAMISFTMMSVNWWVEGSTKKVNDAVRWQLEMIWSNLMRSMTKAFWAGFSPNVKVFDYDTSKSLIYISELKDLSPFSCEVALDEKDQSFNGFYQKAGNVSYATRANGSLANKNIYYPVQYIEPKYSFWYSFMMQNGDYKGDKLLKGAFTPWFFSQVIHLYENRYFYRFSTPLAVGYAPSSFVEDSDGTQRWSQDLMISILKEVRNNSSVSLPSDVDEQGNKLWDLKYLESQMRGYDFESYLKRLDQEMAKAVFLPELMFEAGRVGSYKLGDVHKTTFLMLLNALLSDIKLFIDKYIIPQFVDYNFGNAPYPKFKFERQGTISTPIIVEMINEMVKNGKIDVEIEDIARITGVPLKESELSKMQEKNLKNGVMPGAQPPKSGEEEDTEDEDEKEDDEEKSDKDEKKKQENEKIVVNINNTSKEDLSSNSVVSMFDKFEKNLQESLSKMLVKDIEPNKDSDAVANKIVSNIKGDEFYTEIMSITSGQVGRISEWLQKHDRSLWKDVKVGYRSKLDKIWEQYVEKVDEGLYSNAQSIVSQIVNIPSLTVADARTKLWNTLTDYYLTIAYKRNPKLAVGIAGKIDTIINNIL